MVLHTVCSSHNGLPLHTIALRGYFLCVADYPHIHRVIHIQLLTFAQDLLCLLYMSNKTRKVEEQYIQCDWCGREITDGESLHTISGDFPSIHVHKDRCMRQAICTGIASKHGA